MLTKDALAVFKTKKKLAEVLGLHYQTVKEWGELVPASRAKHVDLAIRAHKAGIQV